MLPSQLRCDAEHANGGKRCIIFSTQFMAKLTEGRKGAGTGFAYNKVQNWGKWYGAKYLSATDLILIPYHVLPAHWVLIVVELKEQRIVCYDSLAVGCWPA